MATWKRCSVCKTEIAFEATHYLCSVSTCRKKRNGFVFCSVDCWEAHSAVMRHRDAWAEEEKAPTEAQWKAEQSGEGDKPKRRVVASKDKPKRRVVGAKPTPVPEGPREVLIVASRLKHFIRETWGMNTSDGVLEPLSEEVRRLCVKAVEKAKEDGRKTVLERDF